MRRSLLFVVIVCTTIALAASTIPAEQKKFDGKLVTDTWYVSLGTSATNFSTEAQLGFGSVVGTFLRLEDDLELDDNRSVWRVNGFYAFNRKHLIDVTYTRASRDSTSIIERNLTIGDPDDGELVTFMLGATIRTDFDTQSAKFFYKYAFQNTGRLRAGLGAGLSLFDYRVEFVGDGQVDDGLGTIVFRRVNVREDLLAPIPSAMLFIDYALTKSLTLRTHAGFFRLDVGDIEGRLIETRFTLDYFVTDRFSLGFGLEGSDIHYRDRGDNPLFLDLSQSSAILYAGSVF